MRSDRFSLAPKIFSVRRKGTWTNYLFQDTPYLVINFTKEFCLEDDSPLLRGPKSIYFWSNGVKQLLLPMSNNDTSHLVKVIYEYIIVVKRGQSFTRLTRKQSTLTMLSPFSRLFTPADARQRRLLERVLSYQDLTKSRRFEIDEIRITAICKWDFHTLPSDLVQRFMKYNPVHG